VTIPAGKRQAVLDVLDDEGIDYVLNEETSDREFTAIIYFPLPVAAVEPVLDELRAVGLDDQAYTVVLEAQTVVSRRFERLRERYAEETETDERIARAELVTTAEDLAPSQLTYVVMSVISAVIATAGLLLDSPAVVVGSMVIAPLIGPAMATSVGTVVDDIDLFRRGVRLQVVGFVAVIASAALFAALVKTIHFIPPGLDVTSIGQVRERLAPDFLSLTVALGAGTAGAFSLSSGVSASLVGVMIAVALVPPAATVGIGIAWGLPSVVLGSGVLALVNALSINLAALATLWYMGYQPRNLFQLDTARSATVTRVAVLIVAIGVLSVFLGGVTYDSFQNADTEQAMRDEMSSVLVTQADAELLDAEVVFGGNIIFRRVEGVVVTIGVSPDRAHPDLADRLERRLEAVVDHDISVEVRYIPFERT